MDGRTDNDIKNKFYSAMRKKLRKINKTLGVKNSTEQVKEIKPKILSNILGSIEKESPHLMTFLKSMSENGSIHFTEAEKELGKELTDKIISLKYTLDKVATITSKTNKRNHNLRSFP